jgi:hypothetical protein
MIVDGACVLVGLLEVGLAGIQMEGLQLRFMGASGTIWHRVALEGAAAGSIRKAS